MNCKPGDLAILIHAEFYKRNIGGLVRVDGWNSEWNKWNCTAMSHMTTKLGEKKPGAYCRAKDQHLRPIRPTDGEDETLQWAGKPNEVTA